MPVFRLTRQSVAALAVPPGKPEAFAWDTDVPGFGVKLSTGGSRRWVLQYRPAGQRGTKRLTIGAVEALPLDDARREARKLLAGALTGNDPHAAKASAKRDAAVTVGTLVDAYLKHCETRQRPTTLAGTKLNLSTHWVPLHALPVAKVKRSDVADRLATLARTSGGVTANRCRSSLSTMFAWAVGSGLAESNPVVGTLKLAEEKSRERVLSERELAAVWHACRDDAHGRILKLLILTGQRRDEVADLTDAELDLDAALWTLPSERSKNHRVHAIPLSAAAVTILQKAPRVEGRTHIFGEGKGGFSGWSRCKVRLDDRLKEAGTPVAPWTLHDLRRTAATLMIDRLGVAPHHVEAVLNHVSGHKGGIAGVYNRAAYATEKRAALDLWAAHVLALAAPRDAAEAA